MPDRPDPLGVWQRHVERGLRPHTLGPQLHVGKRDRPLPSRANFLEYNGATSHGRIKPAHCFWTSTLLRDGSSDWTRWSAREQDLFDYSGGIYRPLPSARVYEIDSYEDLEHLHKVYPVNEDPLVRRGLIDEGVIRSREKSYGLDWLWIAQDFDAVHLTFRGQEETRCSSPHDLYGWDCESTVWFRWVFEDDVQPVTHIRK